jgi:hypothetical protein
MISIQVLPNGNLQLRAGNAARAAIKDQQCDRRSSDDILLDLTEGYWTNGSYAPFDAGDANPFVGLTEAPCIAENLTFDDDCQREIDGRLWAFMDYQIKDPMELLKRNGSVVFKLVD